MPNITERLKLTPAYDVYRYFNDRRARAIWERSGRPVPPPPVVKQEIVRAYARAFDLHTLVETGTYLGEMIRATRVLFDRIYSIEIDRTLVNRARRRFHRHRATVTILHGDSGERIARILEGMEEPCLFWLDSHYSGGLTSRGASETPVMQELGHIFNHRIMDHVILIDDARCFTGQGDYPTLDELREYVMKRHPGWHFSVRHDIIRIHRAVEFEVEDVRAAAKGN